MISSWQKELFWRMLNAGLGQKSVSIKRRLRRGRIKQAPPSALSPKEVPL